MPFILWVVLVILTIDAILGIILKLGGGRPERNTIGWAQRGRGFCQDDDAPILGWPVQR